MSDELNLKTGVSTKSCELAAVQELYQAINQDGICFAAFFCSIEYDRPKLEQAFKKIFKDVSLIGCTTEGELTPEGMKEGSITAFSISSDQFIARSIILDMTTIESKESVAKLESLKQGVESLAGDGFEPLSWLLINSIYSKVERVLGVVDRCFNSMPVVAGSPGGGDDFKPTFVYSDGRFHEDAAIVSYISTSVPFEIFKIDDFDELPERVVLTEVDTAKRIVKGIDGMSAVEGYLAAFDAEPGDLDAQFFATHPLAAKAAGDLYVRAITPDLGNMGVICEPGGLQFFCAVEEGMVLSAVKIKEPLHHFNAKFVELNNLHGAAQLVLACDCIYRKFNYRQANAVEGVNETMVNNKVIGFHGYGEQIGLMHVNQTFTAVYFGTRENEQ